jgi:hypothetical protein
MVVTRVEAIVLTDQPDHTLQTPLRDLSGEEFFFLRWLPRTQGNDQSEERSIQRTAPPSGSQRTSAGAALTEVSGDRT